MEGALPTGTFLEGVGASSGRACPRRLWHPEYRWESEEPGPMPALPPLWHPPISSPVRGGHLPPPRGWKENMM